MPNSANIMMGLTNKSTPLISFYTLIDEDMAVLKHAILHYSDSEAFNLDNIKSYSYTELLGLVYRRKYSNPLYIIMSNDKYKDFLDECYKEFIEEHEYEVLLDGVKTQMFEVIKEFASSGEIIPSILYYTDAQLQILKDEPDIKSIKFIHLNEALHGEKQNVNTQFYFRYLQEAEPFKDYFARTYYFSTSGLNLNEENNDIYDKDFIEYIISNQCRINLFDMYRSDIIGRYDEND